MTIKRTMKITVDVVLEDSYAKFLVKVCACARERVAIKTSYLALRIFIFFIFKSLNEDNTSKEKNKTYYETIFVQNHYLILCFWIDSYKIQRPNKDKNDLTG